MLELAVKCAGLVLELAVKCAAPVLEGYAGVGPCWAQMRMLAWTNTTYTIKI